MAWIEQLKSGRYRAGYRLANGQKRYLPGTYTHKVKARREAETAEQETRTLGWRDPEAAARAWGEWANEWFPNRTVEPSTLKADESRLKRLHTKWGNTPIYEISRYEIKTWAAELLAEELSPASVQRHLALLSASLTAAADAEIIQANPALRLNLGLVSNPSERVLNRQEQHELFDALPTDFDAALAASLLGTGARWGEAIALTAPHFTTHGVRIRNAWDHRNRALKQYTKGKQRRTVPIAPWLEEVVQPLLERHPTGFLFRGDGKQPVDYSNWHKRVWAPTIEKLGFNQRGHDDNVTIHTLRHTYATEQLDAGLTLAEIATLLGHSNIATTERYAHRRPTVRPEAQTAVRDPRTAPPKPPAPTAANIIQFPRRA